MQSVLPSALALAFATALPAMPAAAEEAAGRQETRTFRFESQQQTLGMRYLDARPAQANGRTAVLLHGKNFCADYWEETVAALRDAGFRVVVPEQVGFCGSDLPQRYQYSFHQLAGNTNDLLESLGVERAVVVGHSMGGMLGVRYALMYPQAVERLVLVNPIGLEDWKAKGVPYADIDAQFARELAMDAATIERYQRASYYDGQWTPAYARWAETLARQYQGARGRDFAWSMALTSDMVFTQPVVHEFPQLRVPTTLVVGGRDRTAIGRDAAPRAVARTLGDYPALARAAAEAMPEADLVLFDDLGHLPQVEDFARFRSALLEAVAAPAPD